MVVQIDTKESVSDAAQFLAHKGLIKSEFAFIFQSKFYDYDTIYPGTYTLNTSMTSKEILQLLNEKPETDDSANRPSPAAPRQLKPRRPRAGHLRRKTGTAVLGPGDISGCGSCVPGRCSRSGRDRRGNTG